MTKLLATLGPISLISISNGWIYCITYDKHIVKVGMTIKSLLKRYGSYSAGKRKLMVQKTSTPSTTNFVINEVNYAALLSDLKVEISIQTDAEVYKEQFKEKKKIKEIEKLTGNNKQILYCIESLEDGDSIYVNDIMVGVPRQGV